MDPEIIELISNAFWPVVVSFSVFFFRRPLTQFLEVIGKRATKFSAFDVTIEFPTVPSPPPAPWSDSSIYEGSNLICGNVTSTTIMELFMQIHDDANWNYMVVNIGDGKRWLMSRLFLFTTIFRYMRGLKCVVFVETTNEYRKRLLGLADPDQLRTVMAQKYPWLDQALVAAWLKQDIPPLAAPLPKEKAEPIVNGFMEDERIRSKAPQGPDEWEPLGTPPVWEHTKWLNIARLNEDLKEALFDSDDSQFKWSPDTPTDERNKAVLRRAAPFVALINDRGEFKQLIDRRTVIDQLARRLAEESDKH